MKTNRITIKAIVIISALAIGVSVIYILADKNSFNGTWRHSFFPGLILIISIFSLIVSFFEKKKQEWNNLSLDEKGKRIVEDLKSQKKLWFLNPISPASRNYFALPISEKEAIKRSSSKKSKSITYRFSDMEKVRELVKEGRIINCEETEAILKYC